ncbi:MAG: zinc ABC transporter substrate-binding protein [Candidatus Margulisbacteria bacterium]|nr:zinc ABC transporter substrate-binding protein [Candidatus Margulisiibacteriota bacterium]
MRFSKFVLGVLLFSSVLQAKPLQVVTSTSDLADMVTLIGKDRVSVVSLTTGIQNLHQVEARPSMVARVHQADMVVRIGMDLDSWMNAIIDTAKNPRLRMGNPGYVDASVYIKKLEVPYAKIDGSMGDIHLYGNPHYWLDPENGKVMAKSILDALIALSPEDKVFFVHNYQSYNRDLTVKIALWKSALMPYRGLKILTFHKGWPYLADRFQFQILGEIEPKPGIPPSPSHLLRVITQVKRDHIQAIVAAPYDNLKACEKVAKDAGIPLLVLPSSVEGAPGVIHYTDVFDYAVKQITTKVKL